MASDISKYILITLCFSECLLLSGFIFGWSSLVYVYKELNYFHKYCSDVSTSWVNQTGNLEADWSNRSKEVHSGCKEQDAALDLVFTIATVGSMLIILPLGAVIDHYGVTVGRIICSVLLFCGLLLATFTPPSLSELLFPACFFIAAGGLLLLLVDIKIIAGLKIRRKGTAIAFIDSAFDSSAFVTVIIQIAYNLGLEYRSSFLVILGLTAISIFTTLYTVVYKDVLSETSEDVGPEGDQDVTKTEFTYDNPGMISNNESVPPPTAVNSNINGESAITSINQVEKNFPTLRSAICSALFISLLVWMGLLHLRWTFFIGAFNSWIERLTHHDKVLVNKYTFVCNMIQFGGILTAPAQGYLLDRRTSLDSRDPLRNLKNCRLAFYITAVIFTLFSLCVAIPVVELQYISFMLLSFGRCLLYSLVSAFITFTFPTEYLGRLYGITSIVNAVMTVVQFPLFVATEGSNFGFYINIAFIPLTLISFIHPLYLHVYIKKTLRPKLTGINPAVRMEN